MKKTLHVCVAILGLGFVQGASAATWDGGVSKHVEVKNPDQPDTTEGGVWDGGVSDKVKVEDPNTPDTPQGGVWDAGISEQVPVKYPSMPQ